MNARPSPEFSPAQSRNFYRVLVLPVLAMMVVVAAANWLVQYPINPWFTWGAVVYPLSFLVTELTNRRYGPVVARRMVYLGFAFGVLLSLMVAPTRIAVASGSAFLVAQLLDIAIFNRLRRQNWWRAPFVSAVCSSALDTAVFFSIAFAGTEVPWVTLGIGDFAVKFAMATVCLVPFRVFIAVVRPVWSAPASSASRA
ncbi:MAG: queuosine precursor transporter [Rhodospirillales bacterium]|nr:queuosine precursor transporter [Rhodospirillales bacterium]